MISLIAVRVLARRLWVHTLSDTSFLQATHKCPTQHREPRLEGLKGTFRPRVPEADTHTHKTLFYNKANPKSGKIYAGDRRFLRAPFSKVIFKIVDHSWDGAPWKGLAVSKQPGKPRASSLGVRKAAWLPDLSDYERWREMFLIRKPLA